MQRSRFKELTTFFPSNIPEISTFLQKTSAHWKILSAGAGAVSAGCLRIDSAVIWISPFAAVNALPVFCHHIPLRNYSDCTDQLAPLKAISSPAPWPGAHGQQPQCGEAVEGPILTVPAVGKPSLLLNSILFCFSML